MSGNKNPWSKIEHVVVVMLENRSFDNLLGWLYDPANDSPFNIVPPDFDGLYGKDLFNKTRDGRVIPVGKTEDARSPQPNPGEPFEDVYSQIYDVPLSEFKDVPAIPPFAANMNGFIGNYADQKGKPKDPATIMECLTPKTVPVLSTLAHYYAVCDRWFGSIPTQTFCNRSFVHAGTSSGYVNNGGGGLCFINETRTIFDLLEEAGQTWNVFVGGWLFQSFTLVTQKAMWKYAATSHFAHFGDFLAGAARKGGLPSYSFIEPIYFDSFRWGPENDMHPECNPVEFFGPSNLHRGEALLASIYDAVRNSPDWESTLLVIVFDEHGGCYDHVPPPTAANCDVAINPDGKIIPKGQRGGIGFNFDRLGPRVPAIVVSAYTPAQTRLHDTFEHTSILTTVVNCFGLPKDRLGVRQAKALDLASALKLDLPRRDRPPIARPQYSLFESVKDVLGNITHAWTRNPVTDLQRAALHGAALMTGTDELHGDIETLHNQKEADTLIAAHEEAFVNKSVS
jgi:phospholipase C